jgi:chromosome partitioning protein
VAAVIAIMIFMMKSSLKLICITNQKGGVGKTTTSINLAAALGHLGKRVLLIDMDPQGNSSSGFGLKRHEYQDKTIYQVLIGECRLDEIILPTQEGGVWVAPATPDLVGAEIDLVDAPDREYRLKDAVSSLPDGRFDFVLIDCPPSLGLLTVNSLVAAGSFLVPLQCEYYALEGLSQLLTTAGLVKKSLNPDLHILGIILTMFDTRNNLSHQVSEEIRQHFAEKVFNSVIPRSIRLSEAPSHGKSIISYDPKGIGALRYLELAREVLQRSKVMESTRSDSSVGEQTRGVVV